MLFLGKALHHDPLIFGNGAVHDFDALLSFASQADPLTTPV